MTIQLPAKLESRLLGEASRRGVRAEDLAAQIIDQHLPAVDNPNVNQAAIELLAQWDKEDQTTDPREIERRQRHWDDFKESMNRNGTSDRVIYP
jgi:hypothetical protein